MRVISQELRTDNFKAITRILGDLSRIDDEPSLRIVGALVSAKADNIALKRENERLKGCMAQDGERIHPEGQAMTVEEAARAVNETLCQLF